MEITMKKKRKLNGTTIFENIDFHQTFMLMAITRHGAIF